MKKGRFDLDSARRIARQVRRMEGTPERPTVGQPVQAHDAPFQFRRFTLLDALTPAEGNPGTTATAYLVKWNAEDEAFEVDTDTEFEVRDPSGDRYGIAYDEDLWHRFIGWCSKPFDVPEWEILSLPRCERCTCTMKGSGGNGSVTSCTVDNVVVISGISPLVDTDETTEELTVYTTKACWWQDDATAKIEWNNITERWEIYEINHQAQFVKFTATEDFTTTDASFSASVDSHWDGMDPDPEDAGITIYNEAASSGYIFEGDSGDKGMARLDETTGHYRQVQMECP